MKNLEPRVVVNPAKGYAGPYRRPCTGTQKLVCTESDPHCGIKHHQVGGLWIWLRWCIT